MILRPQYMDALKTYRDVPLVKILAGIRRCGKSTILDMLYDDLLKSGIAEDRIMLSPEKRNGSSGLTACRSALAERSSHFSAGGSGFSYCVH